MILPIATSTSLWSSSLAVCTGVVGQCTMALMVLLPADAAANAESSPTKDTLEPMEVFGQRVPSDHDVSASPITVIDGDELARSGATSLGEYLRRLPRFGFQGVNQNQNDGGYGGSFVDLRNLNFNRTLVLINGQRVVLSGIKTNEAVDLANVSAALVDKIEIMPYGSAPEFGADAVAGVVNIILERDLTGFIWHAGSGISTGRDAGLASLRQPMLGLYGTDKNPGRLRSSGRESVKSVRPVNYFAARPRGGRELTDSKR